jgi:nitrite reductase/ring-hydroxylating ferredoxin subunit
MNNHKRPESTPRSEDSQAQALNEVVDALIAERRPPVPDEGIVEASIMAGQIHGARPLTPGPSASFVSKLGDKLATEMKAALVPPIENLPTTPLQTKEKPKRASRRSLLTMGLSAAAGLAAGAAVTTVIEHHDTGRSVPLVGLEGTWLSIAHINEIPLGGAKRFSTEQVTGHLIHQRDGSFVAFSAACTHMGCIIAWNATTHTFDCPCHNGRFDEQGNSLPNQRFFYSPLPRIDTKIEGNEVYAFVPTNPGATPTHDSTGEGYKNS